MGWHSKLQVSNIRHLPYFVAIGLTVAKIWRFNAIQNVGCPSWIYKKAKY